MAGKSNQKEPEAAEYTHCRIYQKWMHTYLSTAHLLIFYTININIIKKNTI